MPLARAPMPFVTVAQEKRDFKIFVILITAWVGVRIPHGPQKRRSYAILLQNGIAAILYFPYNSLLNWLRIDSRRFLHCCINAMYSGLHLYSGHCFPWWLCADTQSLWKPKGSCWRERCSLWNWSRSMSALPAQRAAHPYSEAKAQWPALESGICWFLP